MTFWSDTAASDCWMLVEPSPISSDRPVQPLPRRAFASAARSLAFGILLRESTTFRNVASTSTLPSFVRATATPYSSNFAGVAPSVLFIRFIADSSVSLDTPMSSVTSIHRDAD